MLDRSAIGRRSEPLINEVEKGAVRRFAQALRLSDAAHFDERHAIAAGHRGLLAPLTFPSTFRSSIELTHALGLGDRVLLQADHAIESFRAIYAGDRIAVVTVVAELGERPGPTGPVDVVVVEDEGRDEEDNLVYRARRTMIVRPQARKG